MKKNSFLFLIITCVILSSCDLLGTNNGNILGCWESEILGSKIYIEFINNGTYQKQINYSDTTAIYITGTYTLKNSILSLTEQNETSEYSIINKDDVLTMTSRTTGLNLSINYKKIDDSPNYFIRIIYNFINNLTNYIVTIKPHTNAEWSEFEVQPNSTYTLTLWKQYNFEFLAYDSNNFNMIIEPGNISFNPK